MADDGKQPERRGSGDEEGQFETGRPGQGGQEGQETEYGGGPVVTTHAHAPSLRNENSESVVKNQLVWASWTGEKMSSGSEDEGDVRYDSDTEQNPFAQRGQGRGRRGQGNHQSKPKPPYKAYNNQVPIGSGSGSGTGPASPTRTQGQGQGQGKGGRAIPEAVLALAALTNTHPVNLKKSAHVTVVDSHDSVHKSITRYIENSSTPKKSRMKVSIENIYACELKEKEPPAKPSTLTKVLRQIGVGTATTAPGGPGGYSMLLWYSAPQSALGSILCTGLKLRASGLLVFYDRACKALANWDKPEHGLLLLCEVSLDKVYKSPHGVAFWARSSNSIPHGYDCIKATGSLMPDWNQNQSHDGGVIIPSGPTVPNPRYKNYEQEYNEYIITDEGRAKVKFVVELSTK